YPCTRRIVSRQPDACQRIVSRPEGAAKGKTLAQLECLCHIIPGFLQTVPLTEQVSKSCTDYAVCRDPGLDGQALTTPAFQRLLKDTFRLFEASLAHERPGPV